MPLRNQRLFVQPIVSACSASDRSEQNSAVVLAVCTAFPKCIAAAIRIFIAGLAIMSLGRAVPWASWDEWRKVGLWLLADEPQEVQRGLDRVRNQLVVL
jgi:hypothetical protein